MPHYAVEGGLVVFGYDAQLPPSAHAYVERRWLVLSHVKGDLSSDLVGQRPVIGENGLCRGQRYAEASERILRRIVELEYSAGVARPRPGLARRARAPSG